eukprot:302644-Pyramimonas_sp.AAC.2
MFAPGVINPIPCAGLVPRPPLPLPRDGVAPGHSWRELGDAPRLGRDGAAPRGRVGLQGPLV